MFSDQLVIPSACIPMVLHACHDHDLNLPSDHAMLGGHLAYKHTLLIDFEVRCYITILKLEAITAKHVNSITHRIIKPSYLQVICALIAHSNAFK